MSATLKDVEKNFRDLGARRAGRDKTGTSWVFPDGAEKLVPRNLQNSTAVSMLVWARDRYGLGNRTSFNGRKVSGRKPVIDLEKCAASGHAQDRLALMRDQLGITFAEVLMAIRAPVRVMWSDKHGSWIWVGERIAVAAHVDNEGFTTIATVLWSTTELWELAPRPEKVGAR